MKTYAVAVYFRFDETYLKRYDMLVGMLVSYPEVWMEAPSMFLLRTDEELETVENKIRNAGFQPETDIVIVIGVTGQETRYAGHIEHRERLEKMLPAQTSAEPADASVSQRPDDWPTGLFGPKSPRLGLAEAEMDMPAGAMQRQHGFATAARPQFGFKNFARPFDPRQ